MANEKRGYMKISEFAAVVGVSVQTLRNWDTSGKLKPAELTDGGHRVYTVEQLLSLKVRNQPIVLYINETSHTELVERVATALNVLGIEKPRCMAIVGGASSVGAQARCNVATVLSNTYSSANLPINVLILTDLVDNLDSLARVLIARGTAYNVIIVN